MEAAQINLQRSCDSCQSPLDDDQRYCVRCGTRQRDVYDPAARYFASSAQRRRRVAPEKSSPSEGGESSAAMRWAAVFLALLPVAVAIGVTVGKTGDDTSKLIDALRHQRGGALATAGTAAQQQAATSPVSSQSAAGGLPSDFPLAKGFAVKLGTLPLSAKRDAATKAESDAKAKGAPSPGLINPRQFRTTPSQGGKYALYAGAFRGRAGAAKLLAKLKKRFPGAQVIAVESVNGASSQGKVLSKTSLGTAHQVAGFKATPARVKHDTQLVQQINHRTGQTYIQSQRGLPDQIVIGGTPGSAPAPPSTGPGQP